MSLKVVSVLGLTHVALGVIMSLVERTASQARAAITTLENDITDLASRLTNQSVIEARSDYRFTRTQFDIIAQEVLPYPGYLCDNDFYLTYQATNLSEAIRDLNQTQNYLTVLSEYAAAQNNSQNQNNINFSYCNANYSFESVEAYTFDVTGQTPADLFTFPIAQTYAQLAVEALQRALDDIDDQSPATTAAQYAFNNSVSAIQDFSRLADLPSAYSCPADTRDPATGSISAGIYAYDLRAYAIPRAYDDRVANAGYLIDFCDISSYLEAIRSYVFRTGNVA